MNTMINRLLRLISGKKGEPPDDDFRRTIEVKARTLRDIRTELDARSKIEPNVAFMREFTKEVAEKYLTTTSRNLMANLTTTLEQKYGDELVTIMLERLAKLDVFILEDLGVDSEMEKIHLLQSCIMSSIMNVEMARRKAPLTN